MEIQSSEVYRLHVPLNRTYDISSGQASEMEVILVTIITPDGIRGIGTADPVLGHATPQTPDEIYASLKKRILPSMVSDTPSNPNELRARLSTFPGEENAQCAAEMAYLDAYCKNRGQSLASLLGGALRNEEQLNGWIGVDNPESMVKEAGQLYDDGFRSIKAKLSGKIENDVARVRALCEEYGDQLQIRLDANEGYPDANTAIKFASQIESHPIAHLEQPVSRGNPEELGRVTTATSLDVMADEPILRVSDGYRYLKNDDADRLKFKIFKSGGIYPTKQGLDMADAADVSCVVGHGFCSAPAAFAEIQLTAAHENVFQPIETVGTLKIADEPFTIRPDMSNGVVEVPDRPGIGTELQDSRLEDFVIESDIVD